MQHLHPRRIARAALVASSLLAFVIAGAGCGAPKRAELDPEQFKVYIADDNAAMAKQFQAAVAGMMQRLEREAAASGEIPTLNILAMSGGGDFGAFGAGFLVGWGQAANPADRRPDFDAVTGVSTGAMLAPFAFVGTDESCLTVETFYRNPKKDWIKDRGLLFFLPSNSSFATLPGLSRDLRSAIDAKFIEQIADQSKQGKILAISATNLDLGRQRFWDLGQEAQAAAADGDDARVQDIMLASAAIPAFFPPVVIDDAIYGDGGVTANVFLRLDPRSPGGLLQRWKAANPGKPFPKVRYWVIINNQLQHIPKTVQETWPSVAAPALEVAIRSATISEARWLAAEVDYVNAAFGTDIEVRLVAIPSDWRPPVKGSFQKETMNSLADLGRKMGADPASWQIWASPETARAPVTNH